MQVDVVGDGVGEKKYVLMNHRDISSQIIELVFPNIDSVNFNASPIDLIKTAENIDDRRFSRTGSPNKRERLARFQLKGNIFQHPFFIVVSKPDILKFDGAFQVFRLMNARIGGFLPGIQYGENSFITDHAHLQRIKLVDQLTHRAENHIDIHDEGNHHTERYRAIESPFTSEPNQQTQCDRYNNFNNRKEYGKIPVRP